MSTIPQKSSSNVTPLRSAGVVVSNVKRIDKGALRAIFDCEIPAWNLTLRDCKHFRKDGRDWIGLPSTSWTNRDGKTVYKDIIEFTSKEASDRFQQACLTDLK